MSFTLSFSGDGKVLERGLFLYAKKQNAVLSVDSKRGPRLCVKSVDFCDDVAFQTPVWYNFPVGETADQLIEDEKDGGLVCVGISR